MKKAAMIMKKVKNSLSCLKDNISYMLGGAMVNPCPVIVTRTFLMLVLIGLVPFNLIALQADTVSADDTSTASIQVMPSEGPVGTKVVARISNYKANKQLIVTFGTGTTIGSSTIVAAKATTDDSGYAVAEFDVDLFPAGSYIVMADDGTNLKKSSFKVTPSLVMGEVVSGIVGDTVVVSGNGFGAKKLIHVGIDDEKLVTCETDDKGRFYDSKFIIPPCTRGIHSIKASDSLDNTATASYTVRQNMIATPTAVTVGSEITLYGTGFSGVTDVIIYFDDKETGVIQTDKNGDFTAKIKIPVCGDGIHKVKVDDRTNKAFQDITVAPLISIGPTNGYIGIQVGVQGSGFRPGFPTTFYYDNTKLDGTVVSEVGSFAYNFIVPVSKHGDHIITASDGINVQKATFTIESVPPLAPTLSLPADAERLTKDVHFEWTTVSDPSGVTYTLQVADDARFDNILVSQSSIQSYYYDITGDSKLLTSREKPYYWRVKATDRASNEGIWSQVSSIYMGHTIATVINNMPDWVKWVLVGLGLLLFAVTFLWMGNTIRKLRRIDEDEDDDSGEYASGGYGLNQSSDAKVK